jgi:hypothetical protein
MTRLKTALALAAGLSLALAACGGGGPSLSELEAVQTIAAATAVMGITQTAAAMPPSPTPEPPTATPTEEPPSPTPEPPTNTPDATAASLFSPTPGLPPVLGAPPTSTPGGQPAGSCTYAAAFEGVETIPDGTQYPFGKPFTKTWRIKNTGTCTWDGSLNLIWVYSETDGQSSSELMGSEGVIAVVTTNVPPNGYLDINVDFVTPSKVGTYRVEFKLRSSTAIFGVNGGGTLWVEIKAYDPGGGPAPTPTP